MATIGGCTGFGAVYGSSVATVATMTRVALPEMLERRYSSKLATGCIAAGGTLGMLIPPSIIMVLYGFLTEQFVIALFIAAIVPGIITVLFYAVAIALYVRVHPEAGPPRHPAIMERSIGRHGSGVTSFPARRCGTGRTLWKVLHGLRGRRCGCSNRIFIHRLPGQIDLANALERPFGYGCKHGDDISVFDRCLDIHFFHIPLVTTRGHDPMDCSD